MDLCVEDGEAGAVGGEGIGVGSGLSGDEAVESQSSQVVAHVVGGVVHVEQAGDEAPEVLVGEAGDGMDVGAERAGQGCDARMTEA